LLYVRPTSGPEIKESPVTVQAIEAPRSITLADLRDMLVTEHAEKLDLVIPATKIRAKGGRLVVSGAELVLTDGGFLDPNGAYDVADTCDDGISAKLEIPRAFLRRMHSERPDVWDMLVTRLLQGASVFKLGEDEPTVYPADDRTFLLRTFVTLPTDQTPGRRVARALLSDRYEIIDNLDYLTAVLTGVRESGVDVEIDADITDRRMYVRLVAPGVSVDASAVLRGYRSPFASPDVQRAGRLAESYGGTDGAGNVTGLNPGLVIKNSEVGAGGHSLTPRMQFPICRNGLTVTADIVRGIHLGGRKAESGVVYAEDTQRAELEVITKKTRDAVKAFLDPAYVQATLDRIAEDMGQAVTDAQKHVEVVSTRMKFSAEVQAGVFDHFIRGGQMTAGGVMQAVTSFAQTVSDADLAAELEEMALDVLQTSASLARSAR
jgi:hypothetical protein